MTTKYCVKVGRIYRCSRSKAAAQKLARQHGRRWIAKFTESRGRLDWAKISVSGARRKRRS